jgi:hypothetical protein
MYVYLALLLCISILIVWVYRRYMVKLEPFDLLADGVTKQVYSAACWNNRSCPIGPTRLNTFSALPPGYSIFPIRITQDLLTNCWVRIRSNAGSGCGDSGCWDGGDIDWGDVKSVNNTILTDVPVKLKNNVNPSMKFRTTKTATTTYVNTKVRWSGANFDTLRDHTVIESNENNAEMQVYGTNHLFNNTDFKFYRPATLGELAWLKLNSPNNSLTHYILQSVTQRTNVESNNSEIQFIVGPTPNGLQSSMSSEYTWITYTSPPIDHREIIDKSALSSVVFYDAYNYWSKFNYKYKVNIVGNPITTFNVDNAPNVQTIDSIMNSYATSIDTDISLNSSLNSSYDDVYNNYRRFDNVTQLVPIFKKYIFNGTKTYSRGCNTAGCKVKMQLLQSTYTAYNLQELPECAGCLNSDYTDISGLWSLPSYSNGIIQTSMNAASEITLSFVASDFTNNRAPKYDTPMYLPAQVVTTNEAYVFQLFRVNRDTSWSSNSTITGIITSNADILSNLASSVFTIPSGKRINTFTVNLNARTITFPDATNGTFTLPANTFFYHTYTANDKDRTGAVITADPIYVVRIYKRPLSGAWNIDSGNSEVKDIAFDGWFGVKPRKITMARDSTQMYKYTASFTDTQTNTNTVSLPAGSYSITLKARDVSSTGILVPDKTVAITAAGAFTGFDLNLSGLGTLTLNDTAQTAISINEVYALRGGIPNFTIEIRATATGNPIFAMDPISLDQITYTAGLQPNSTNYDVIFDKGYSFDISGTTQPVGFYLTHSKTGTASTARTFTNVTNVRGFRVKLNTTDGSGAGAFVFLTTNSADISGTETYIPKIFTYDSTTNLAVDITVNGRQVIPALPQNNIPPTSLTIGNVTANGSNSTGVGGNIIFNNTTPIRLQRDSYTITISDSITPTKKYLTFTQALTSTLSSYTLTPPNTLQLFSGGSTTAFVTTQLTTDITADTSVKVSIENTTIGTLTSTTYNINAIKITRIGTLTNDGYVISGTFSQGSSASTPTLSNIPYTIKMLNTAVNGPSRELYTLQSSALSGASGYELNISKNTLKFIGTTVVLPLQPAFISKVTSVTPMNLQLTLNDSISYETPLTLPRPEFAITQTETGYTYEFPDAYVLIKDSSSDYKLTLKAGGEFSSPYGEMVFKPTANTRKFTVNINTGEIAFISTAGATINRFDVQALRESMETTLTATLDISGVTFPPNAATTTTPIKPTRFEPLPNAGVYSASDNTTNVRVDLGAQSGSLSGSAPVPGSITPVTRLEPSSTYTITVKRNNSDILFQSTFVTASDTTAIAAVNYNRDANTILFIDAAGKPQPEIQTALTSQLTGSAAPDLRRMNNETIKIEITQSIDYSSKANSASDGRTLPSTASGTTTKSVLKQTNPSSLGVQTITPSWNKGYVIFSLTNGSGKSANLASGNYVVTIISGSNKLPDVSFNVAANTSVKYVRLNVFTGELVAITNTGSIVRLKDDTGARATTSAITLSASISLGGATLYDASGVVTVEPFSIPCANETETTTDIFVLLDSGSKGFTYDDALKVSLPDEISLATSGDVKAAAKAGANWDTPGWILSGDADKHKSPVYPVNENGYSEIQIYAVPHHATFAAEKAPGPLAKGPYVISYLPPPAAAGEEPKAGILVKGDRTKVPTGFTAVKFNTYTGQESFTSTPPSNEIFHVSLPADSTFEAARKACKNLEGDIALDSTVDAGGLTVPIGAQWQMPGFIYRSFATGDASNRVSIGYPKPSTTANKTGIYIVEGNHTTTTTLNGVICYGSKKNMNRETYEVTFDASGNVKSGTVSDYNYNRHVWSKNESISPILYSTYTPKNIDAIVKETNPDYKAAMIVNDGRAQQNIVFSRYLDDAEFYAGCDVRNMTCIAKSSDDPEIEDKYTAPTSSTGKWVNVDLDEVRMGRGDEGFQGSNDYPLPVPGMQRMMSDMELFGRTPVALEGLVGGVAGQSSEVAEDREGRPQIPMREGFVNDKVGVDDATRQSVIDILDCQSVGGAVNITRDGSVYPGCNTLCCIPDDGRKLDPSLIRNRRKTSGPGAATCDDEGGCKETTSKAPIRHTPSQPAFRLKKKTDAPAPPAPTKCTSATPLRTQVANAKRDKLEALRNKPVN